MPRWTQLAVDVVAGFGRVVSSKLQDASKAVLVTLRLNEADEDDPDGEESADEPLFTGIGFYARPLPAVKLADGTPLAPSGSAEIVGLRFGDAFQPIAGRDLRISSLMNPAEGELGIAHYGGGFVALKTSTDGAGTEVTILAPHRTSDATIDVACALMLDPAQPAVALVNSDGCALTMADGTTLLKNKDGSAWLGLDDGGGKIVGGTLFFNGQSITIYCPNGAGALATAAHVISMQSDGDIAIVHKDGAWIGLTDEGVTLTSETKAAIVSVSGDGVTIRSSGAVVIEGNTLLGSSGGTAVLNMAGFSAWKTAVDLAIAAIATAPPGTGSGPAIVPTGTTPIVPATMVSAL